MPRPQKGALFQPGIRTQTRKRRGGRDIVARKGPQKYNFHGNQIIIPKDGRLRLFKNPRSEVAVLFSPRGQQLQKLVFKE